MMEKRRRRVIYWFVKCGNKLYKYAINPVIIQKPVYKSRTPQIRDNIFTLLNPVIYFSTLCLGNLAPQLKLIKVTGRSQVRVPMRWIFSIDLILPVALWPWDRLSL
jgi:hypothetical protein